MSALSNLEQLLRSRNVGPKAIASVLPDASASFPTLLTRLEALYAATPAESSGRCIQTLRESANSKLDGLEKTLHQASRRKFLNAATRLKLEADVVQVVRELGGVLPLFELFSDVQQPTTIVDWLEALSLSRSGDQSNAPGTGHASATLVSNCDVVPVRLLPRVALNLVRLAATLVHVQGEPVRLSFSGEADAFSLTVDREPAAGTQVHLLLPRRVDSTAACLTAAAHQLCIATEQTENSVSMTWTRPDE